MKAWIKTFLVVVAFVPVKSFRLFVGIVRAKEFRLTAVVVLALCFFYVWPGVWRYHYSGIDKRVDRLTGQAQRWNYSTKQWGPLVSPDAPSYRGSDRGPFSGGPF